MPDTWTHVGRCWTNGEPFLAMDVGLLPHWRGMSDNTFQELVPQLGYEVTSLAIGPGRAGLIMTDPEISDEGWLEVFRADDKIAVVQAYAADYPTVLAAALAHPADDDQAGDPIDVPNGRLAILSAALDGDGPDGAILHPESPGPLPTSWDLDPLVPDVGGPVLDVGPRSYGVAVRWMTELDEDVVFARWLLTPSAAASTST